MARFSGLVGFVHSERVRPGVTEEVATEKGPYFGDVKRAALSQQQSAPEINPSLRSTNTIEIVADAYVSENIFAIRYVVWAGVAWNVVETAYTRPRLQLRLGGVYDGTRPAVEVEAPDTP